MGKTILKIILKTALFAVIFAVLWIGVQNVLSYDWNQSGNADVRYKEFEKERDLDVLLIGASNIFADAAPAVMWDECGITGYNMGTSSICTPLMYYQLKYALKSQNPEVVVIDISGLSALKDLDKHAADYEALYRKVAATIPDLQIRREIIDMTCELYPGQDRLTYWFPLLRYHQRWEELEDFDFDPEILSSQYNSFQKGCLISTTVRNIKWPDNPLIRKKKSWPLYEEYLQKMIDMCAKKNINVLLMLCPKAKIYNTDYTAGRRIAKANDLPFISFTTLEEVKALGIDPKHDYYDKKHLNMTGQEKFSRYLAGYLKDHYTFEDHSQDTELTKSWNQAFKEYDRYFRKETAK